MPQASPGDFCLGNFSVSTTPPTHLVTSSSLIDEPSSRHARTLPSLVITRRILTSPLVDGSRFSPSFQHAWTFVPARFIVRMTSPGGIWCAASHGSSPEAALMSPELSAVAAGAGPLEAAALDAAGAGVDESDGAAALEAGDELSLAEPLLALSPSSFGCGVPPPHASGERLPPIR